MSDPEDVRFDEERFTGTVRLFPLPNLVLFPHVMQPLHVFEPRYRELVEDALSDDRLVAMALLKPGWEPDYEGRPALFSTACLGRIVKDHRLPDGRFNLLLVGLRRLHLTRELPRSRLFRQAQVEILADESPASGAARRARLKRKLVESFRKLVPNVAQAQEQFNQLLGDGVSLGTLTDVVSYALTLDQDVKIELLAETNVDRRARRLIELLKQMAEAAPGDADADRDFPPPFSAN
jgi:Lon protease-like protein